MEVNAILKFCFTLGLGLFLVLGLANPSLASIHAYPESPGQTMYRSVQSFRDDANRAWQVVLYKRVKGGLVDSIHLRLVGFPGIVEVAHPEKIEIRTGTGKFWQATDVFDASLLPTNVGEYDLLEFMKQLDSNPPLELKLPLKDDKNALLTIPPFAVEEWRKLVLNY
jgi:Protein of unknown function (DUF3122)